MRNTLYPRNFRCPISRGMKFALTIGRSDDRDYGLSDGQCNGAFPEYFYEIERAMSWQQTQEQQRQSSASARCNLTSLNLMYSRDGYANLSSSNETIHAATAICL